MSGAVERVRATALPVPALRPARLVQRQAAPLLRVRSTLRARPPEWRVPRPEPRENKLADDIEAARRELLNWYRGNGEPG